VQSCHAAIEAARHLIPPDLPHPHLVVCSVRDEPALWLRVRQLQRHGVRFRAFFEPDRGDELTALATESVFGPTRRLFRGLRLLTPGKEATP
jgi:hypothetical protein